MIIVAHFCNEIINHYNISTPEKLGGVKFRQQPHSVANPTKAEQAQQAEKEMAIWRIKTQNQSDIKALANEDTLLPTQMFPRLPARATFAADTNFVILSRNILCPQQMFPSLRSPRNIMGNNVSATICPRLPGP